MGDNLSSRAAKLRKLRILFDDDALLNDFLNGDEGTDPEVTSSSQIVTRANELPTPQPTQINATTNADGLSAASMNEGSKFQNQETFFGGHNNPAPQTAEVNELNNSKKDYNQPDPLFNQPSQINEPSNFHTAVSATRERQQVINTMNQRPAASSSNLNSRPESSHKKGLARVTKADASRARSTTQSATRKPRHAISRPMKHIFSTQEEKGGHNRPDSLKACQSTREALMSGPPAAKPDNMKKFIVGVDFGTTTTAVSYYSYPMRKRNPTALHGDINSIMNWPGDGNQGMMRQAPTQSWYAPKSIPRPVLQDQLDLDYLEVPSCSGSETEDGEYDDQNTPLRITGTSMMPSTANVIQNFPDRGQADDECAEHEEYLWGNEVMNARYDENVPRDTNLLIERSKSMLVRASYVQDDWNILRTRLRVLIERGVIRKYGQSDVTCPRDVQDTISDFLTQVLTHTGKELTAHEDLTPQCPVTFVITVPVIWSPNSSRVLQYAMEDAIRDSGFSGLSNGSIDNLYITTEPQAAATFLLAAARNILPGDIIVILDCGGGTVDASTHEVSNSTPLKLKRQVGQPTGDNCGGSYLNDLYAKRILWRLYDEHYLDANGETREAIANRFVPKFESHHKRFKNVMEDRPLLRLPIPGLREDRQKRFERNTLVFNCSTTVTYGSILNHLDVGHGEERLAYSSFGFLRIEPYDPDQWEGHRAAAPFQDRLDGDQYVKVINYFMDSVIARKHTFEPLRSIHAFKLTDKALPCEEVVFVSDFANESHYAVDHPKNKTAQVSDKVIIKITDPATNDLVQATYPTPDENGNSRGKPHYKVEFDLYPIAEDGNLRYEARHPDTGKVLKTGQVSIAAAFRPGTF
ncbi:hypothetical protein LSUE1_G007261 [Lachnellula suecica]|uniref:Uncharacterized protein n=1 Tax=Lachnellula suecica TaxID=602035 RepID=A0A8T9CDJ5_9HELO|nr:hypothetical protein LSUE1_G007261 [Lachnellula suecica]